MVKRVLGASAALVLLALAVALVPQRGKASDVDNVLVVNGPKKPVPVTGSLGVNGTVNANVTNTPNVNVANTPNVNINSLPAVQLAGGTMVGISGPVSLAADTVVGATNADAAQALQVSESFGILAGVSSDSSGAFLVPAGKRFVMEDFSGDASIPKGQKLLLVGVAVAGNSAAEDVPTFLGPLDAISDQFAWGRLARLYADAGTEVRVVAARSGLTGSASVSFHINGYLVNR